MELTYLFIVLGYATLQPILNCIRPRAMLQGDPK